MTPTSHKGKGIKTVMRRPVPISPKFAERQAKLAVGRASDAPLLTKPNGRPWVKSDHYEWFVVAAKHFAAARAVSIDRKFVVVDNSGSKVVRPCSLTKR